MVRFNAQFFGKTFWLLDVWDSEIDLDFHKIISLAEFFKLSHTGNSAITVKLSGTESL